MASQSLFETAGWKAILPRQRAGTALSGAREENRDSFRTATNLPCLPVAKLALCTARAIFSSTMRWLSPAKSRAAASPRVTVRISGCPSVHVETCMRAFRNGGQLFRGLEKGVQKHG